MPFRVAGAKVLVTGGTGMIGQAIVHHLQDAGAEVTTLSRRGARPGNPDHTALAGDINDADSLDFRGFDGVIHGAAWVGFNLSPEKEVQLMHTNVEGTRNVLEAAARDGVRKVVHVSSVAALGDCLGKARDESWFHERPETFQSAYERSKYEAHKILLAEERVETAAVMPSVVLGLGDSSSGLLLKRFLQGRLPVVLKHPGRLAFVHVDDVASATVAALERGSGPYVLSERSMHLPDLFDLFAEVSGKRRPRLRIPFTVIKAAAKLTGGIGAFNADFVRSLAVDSEYIGDRARAELGWMPDLEARLRDDAARFAA